MSTGSLFFVYAPDYTDEGALQRRLEVRPKHLENAKSLIANGTIKVGGAFVDPATVSSETKKMTGSGLVLQAASLEDAKKIVEGDIYWTAGVWDKEKTVVVPYLAATQLP
ncbi:hypothetical protein OE88DRAFT_1638060 [Heliocybe sulcata]|uniref:YCII-related domain-containing protein n=1 Tax=Heliocybe sulcata TaxID=5364 RepID=A0A5C3MQH5_9AGAM|nr:hypothetical protein OE88DRAFT_1638060 [Heliocybe sulcata]